MVHSRTRIRLQIFSVGVLQGSSPDLKLKTASIVPLVINAVGTDEQAAAVVSTAASSLATTLLTLFHPENLMPKIPDWCSMKA